MEIQLPASEFEVLVQDEDRIVLYDKIVDKIYTYNRKEHGWKFPAGARFDVITTLTGVKLN